MSIEVGVQAARHGAYYYEITGAVSGGLHDRHWLLRDGFGRPWRLTVPQRRSTAPIVLRPTGPQAVLRDLADDAFAPWGTADRHTIRDLLEICYVLLGRDLSAAYLFCRRGEVGWRERIDTVRDALLDGFRGGWLLCESAAVAPAPDTIRDLEDIEGIKVVLDSPTEVVAPSEFEVRWVDELGEPIARLDIVFSVSGRREIVMTDGDGVARFTDIGGSSFASAQAANQDGLREAVKERWNTIREGNVLTEADALIYSIQSVSEEVHLESGRLRTISVQPYVSRVRLLGEYFDKNKSFILPNGIAGIRALVGRYKENPETKLLAIGHTDTSGASNYNDALSFERAEALKSYLTDDVEPWLKWYGGKVAAEKRWGNREDLAMIEALPDEIHRDENDPPITWFQRTRGLNVDGVAGAETRRALVSEYMALDETSLPLGIEPAVHGCGENFPQQPLEEEVDSDDNRRVEVFFFDGVLGIQPPLSGRNSGVDAPEYPEWVRRAKRTDDHIAKDGPELLVVRLHDGASKAMPFAEAVVTIGARRTMVQADDEGLIVFRLPLLCPSRFHIAWGSPGQVEPFPFEQEAVAECALGAVNTVDRNRLHNLGYTFDVPFDVAAAQFQRDFLVDHDPEPRRLVGGALPPATHELLRDIFEGSCEASMPAGVTNPMVKTGAQRQIALVSPRIAIASFREILGLYKPGHDDRIAPAPETTRGSGYLSGYVSDDDKGRIFINRTPDGTWKRSTQYIEITAVVDPPTLSLSPSATLVWYVEDPDDPTNESGMQEDAGRLIDPNDYDWAGKWGSPGNDNDPNVQRRHSPRFEEADAKYGLMNGNETRIDPATRRSKVRFLVSDIAGDNYRIRAELKRSPKAEFDMPASTGTMTVWNRVEVEYVRMGSAQELPMDAVAEAFDVARMQIDVSLKRVVGGASDMPFLGETHAAADKKAEAYCSRARGEFTKEGKDGWFFVASVNRFTRAKQGKILYEGDAEALGEMVRLPLGTVLTDKPVMVRIYDEAMISGLAPPKPTDPSLYTRFGVLAVDRAGRDLYLEPHEFHDPADPGSAFLKAVLSDYGFARGATIPVQVWSDGDEANRAGGRSLMKTIGTKHHFRGRVIVATEGATAEKAVRFLCHELCHAFDNAHQCGNWNWRDVIPRTACCMHYTHQFVLGPGNPRRPIPWTQGLARAAFCAEHIRRMRDYALQDNPGLDWGKKS